MVTLVTTQPSHQRQLEQSDANSKAPLESSGAVRGVISAYAGVHRVLTMSCLRLAFHRNRLEELQVVANL